MDTLGIDKAHVAGTSTGGCVLQNLAIDYPERLRCCIFSNTWVKADEYITRVQMTRKRIALSYGPEEYVKVSSLFTNGAMQFRYDLDKVMELERRALETVAPVEVLAQRLDMTLAHDRDGRAAQDHERPRWSSARSTMRPCRPTSRRTCTRRLPARASSSSRRAATTPIAAIGRSGTRWWMRS